MGAERESRHGKCNEALGRVAHSPAWAGRADERVTVCDETPQFGKGKGIIAMNRLRSGQRTAIAAALVVLGAPLCRAESAADAVKLTAVTLAGKELRIPDGKQPFVLLFARIGQKQTDRAIQNLKAALKETPSVQAAVILSGASGGEEGRKKFAGRISWPVVWDGSYATMGQLRVRVWPTTVIVSAKGRELARVVGSPASYLRDLSAHLAYTAGKIDRRARDLRLRATGVVGDDATQVAARHLRVAQRLLARGLTREALHTLDKGLKLAPRASRLLLARATVMLWLGHPQQALDVLDRLSLGKKPPLAARAATLRGGAMVALSRWDAAIRVLRPAVDLNPDPAETYYFLGIAYQKKDLPSEAAQAFRAAFEATAVGRPIALPPPQPKTQPTTRPKR